MTKLIIALFAQAIVPNMAGTNLLSLNLNDKDSLMSYAADIQSKTSEEEQAVLKTLLNGRGHWHPEAESLLRVVEQRPSSRRLGSGVGAHCDASTKAMCAQQVDKQCKECHWDDTFNKCEENRCELAPNQAECCANTMKIATGCFWNADFPDSLHNKKGMCMPKTCEKVLDFKGALAMAAQTNAQCKAQPGCTLVCETENAATGDNLGAGYCEEKGTYTCKTDATSGMTSAAQKATSGSPQDLEVGLNALNAAMGHGGCSVVDCSTCLKQNNCAEKKTSVMAGGKCHDKCKDSVQTAAAVECMFCGQKAAGCTPAVATPPSSCDAIAEPTLAELRAAREAAKQPACTASCSTALAACPNGAGQEMKCVDKTPKVASTSGAAGLIAAMVGLIAPVFALVL